METDRLHTAAFTGHRDYRDDAPEALRQAVRALYNDGVRDFLCGMAVGFDLAAAEAVVALRATCPGMRLVAVLPFAGQSDRFTPDEELRHARLTAEADACIRLAADYGRGCYHRRNDFRVSHAAVLVAWYDGRKGGTQYTFRQALRKGLRIVNLAPTLRAETPDPELFPSR